jgi:hypothetical protein
LLEPAKRWLVIFAHPLPKSRYSCRVGLKSLSKQRVERGDSGNGFVAPAPHALGKKAALGLAGSADEYVCHKRAEDDFRLVFSPDAA